MKKHGLYVKMNTIYAIDLTDDKECIVKGYEPELEEVEKVADRIEEFFDLIVSNEIEIR